MERLKNKARPISGSVIRNIYDKLHVHSRGEAIATALKGNIL